MGNPVKNIILIADPDSIHDQKKIAYLADHGYHCHVVPLAYQNKKAAETQWIDSGYHGKITIHPAIQPFSIPRFFKTFQEARRLRRLIRKEQIKLLLIIYLEPGALWALVAVFLKLPYILFAYGTDVLKTIPTFFERSDIQSKYIRFLYCKAFQKADYIVGTSKNQTESIRQMAGSKGFRRQPLIIRTGIDIKKMEGRQFDQPVSRLLDSQYVFFPRTVAPLYNHEFCLEAIALLPEEVRQNTSFVFVNMYSKDETYITRIKKIIAGTKASVLFLEGQTQEAMFGLYQQAALVVMTPLSDGTPVSAMECMYFAKPLILGPVAYDADVFSWPVLQLKTWDANELAALMNDVLTYKMDLPLEQLKERAIRLCDREKEMLKLKEVIDSLTK